LLDQLPYESQGAARWEQQQQRTLLGAGAANLELGASTWLGAAAAHLTLGTSTSSEAPPHSSSSSDHHLCHPKCEFISLRVLILIAH